MKIQLRTIGLGLLVGAVVAVSGASSAQAFPGFETRVRPFVPAPGGSPVVPRLGIMGHIEYGWGMVVDSVVYGTAASRIGLERGDVILKINGQEITNDRTYRQALLNAVRFENGLVRMQIADVRNGRRVFRTGYLNANPGVVRPRSAPYSDNGLGNSHHNHQPQFGLASPSPAGSRNVRSTEW